MPELPQHPSAEYLRKAAKRAARANGVPLAAAQRAVAQSHGFTGWTALMRAVDERTASRSAPPLLAAVRARDGDAVQRLLDAGVNPRVGDGVDLPLHVAARSGQRALVERLIEGGALAWQPDGAGRTALDAARLGRTRERAAIVALLDRTIIREPSFRAAVRAIHAGDVASLERLIAARPSLLHERNVGPEAYRMAKRSDYFRDPKLFWFIANNPILVERMPDNLVEVASTMLRHGVEQADRDYALGLVMTGAALREQGLQLPLVRALLDAGAVVTEDAMHSTAGHRELDAVRAAIAWGVPMTAPIAAALGDVRALEDLLPRATPADVQAAFGFAIINHRIDAAELALRAGADVDGRMPVHTHSTALHEAAGGNRVDIIAFLLAHGARTDIRDTLWDATPLGWARYGGRTEAIAVLEPITPA